MVRFASLKGHQLTLQGFQYRTTEGSLLMPTRYDFFTCCLQRMLFTLISLCLNWHYLENGMIRNTSLPPLVNGGHWKTISGLMCLGSTWQCKYLVFFFWLFFSAIPPLTVGSTTLQQVQCTSQRLSRNTVLATVSSNCVQNKADFVGNLMYSLTTYSHNTKINLFATKNGTSKIPIKY